MKKWKKGMLLATVAVLIAGSTPIYNVNAQDTTTEADMPEKAERPEYNKKAPTVNNKWDGTQDTEWLGKGTKKSPYLIFTPEEFAGMLASSESNKGAYYKLMEDINLNIEVNKQNNVLPDWWLDDRKYYGIFDGNDHCVTEFDSERSLFGFVQDNASISNLTIYGECNNTAVFCDELMGNMNNCINYVDCNGSAGGMIGWIGGNAKVEYCYNYGEYVLDVSGRFIDSYRASVVGGIVSGVKGWWYNKEVNVTIKNCANFGDITMLNSVDAVGGIFGGSLVPNDYSIKINIEGCENYGDIYTSEISCVGGIFGFYSNYIRTNFVTANLKNCANYGNMNGGEIATGGIAGTRNIGVTINKSYNRGYIEPAYAANSGISNAITRRYSEITLVGTVNHSYSISNLITKADDINVYGISHNAENSYYVGNATDMGTASTCFKWNTYEEGLVDKLNMEGKAFEVNELSELQNGFPVLTWEKDAYKITELKQTDITDKSLTLKWSIIPRATGYEVYRSETKDGEMKLVGDTVDYWYTDQNVNKDTTYFYKVRAYRTENGHTYYGPYSDIMESVDVVDYIEGFCVEDFISNGLGSEGMIFNWTPIQKAAGYEVIRTKGSESKVFDLTGAERKLLIDYEALPKETYTYQIRPYILVENEKYYGETSDGIEVTVPEIILGDISGDKAVTLEDAQITLKVALKILTLDKTKVAAADVNASSSITLEDAQIILKAALKIIKLQPKNSEDKMTESEDGTHQNPSNNETTTDDGYIIEGITSRYITEAELDDMDIDVLAYARNEVYARHGMIFNSQDLQEYYETCDWYEGTIPAEEFDDNILNDYEKANVKLISEYESKYLVPVE